MSDDAQHLRDNPTRRAWAEFDLGVLRSNLREIRHRVGRPVEVIASVKADGYGHGATAVARSLETEGVLALATGTLSEAIAIRRAGVSTPILLFPGYLADAVPTIVEHDLMPSVDRIELAQAISAHSRATVRIWVKVDAGLGRHGVPLDGASDFIVALTALPNIALEGVYTHLPFVDEAGKQWAADGVARFESLLGELASIGRSATRTQALSSAGALSDIADPSSAICPGHALYGIPAAAPDVLDMRGIGPVARSIKTRLAHVVHHGEPRSAGVGGSRRVEAGAVTGIAPLGRRDGYRWLAGQHAAMLVGGRAAPVIGLSLEHVTIDLTALGHVEPGAEVVALGEQGNEGITLADLASWRGSTPVETLLDFAGRIDAHYLDVDVVVGASEIEEADQTGRSR